jgi:DNA-binding CsgD family transcriptional regulator
LMEAISTSSRASAAFGRSIPIRGTPSEPALVAHVIPLRGAGIDVFAGALSILFITPVVPNSSPGPEVLQALFDLTPAEARTAGLITAGKSIEQISMASGTAQNTIRTQLKSVFLKTGVQRQAELVSLLGMAIK